MDKNLKLKAVLLVAVLFLIAGFVRGQQISKEDFDKGVDYLNCKTVELSLSLSPTKGVTDKFKSKCACNNNPDFEKIKAGIEPSEKVTLNLSDEVNRIKDKEFNDNLTSKNAIKLLSTDVFENYPALTNLWNKIKPKTRDSLKEDLTNAFAKQFPQTEVISENSNRANTTSELPNSNGESNKNNPPVNESFFNFALVLSLINLILLLSVAALAYFRMYRKLTDKVNSLSNIVASIERKPSTVSKVTVSAGANSTAGDITELKNIVAQIESKIVRLEESMATLNRAGEKDFITSSSFENEQYDSAYKYKNSQNQFSTSSKEVLYFPSPNEDGSFMKSSASTSFKEGSSIYRFTKLSDQRAEFQIEENETSLSQALQYPETNIERVCNAQNSRQGGERKIVTLKPGIAELNNDRWELKQKAVIKYEH